MTERSPALRFLMPRQTLELSLADAERFGVAQGDQVNVRSNGHSVSAEGRDPRADPPGSGFLIEGLAEQGPNALAGAETVEIEKAGVRKTSRDLPLAEVGFAEATWVLLVKSVIIFALVFAIVPVLTVVERKILGRFQARYGPNRVGPMGLAQPLADAIKLVGKEAYKPDNATGFLWAIAPAIVVFTGVATLAILPWGNTQEIGNGEVGLYGIDVSIGVLYFFAFGSIAFYGLLLGGWASGSKYSFLGAMRSAAQLISYEISMGLALLGAVMMAGSLSLTEIVEAQGEIWYIVPQFVGFLCFMVAGFAETSRAPFDLPEADAELVAGYQTEYGGMRWGTFMMAEYIEMFVVSGIAATFFLGGWMGPGPGFLDPIWMLLKILALDVRLLLDPGDPAARPLRPADEPRLEDPPAPDYAERPGDRCLGRRDMSEEFPYLPDDSYAVVQRGPEPGGPKGAYRVFGETLRGLKTTMARMVEGPKTVQYPEEKTPVYPALPRPPQAPPVRGHGPREVRRLLALRRRVSCGLHPRRRRRERPRRPRLGRRALRVCLRDQPRALHLLRLLRGRLPVRRDHDGPRLRDGRLQPRRPDLHQGDAPRRADRAHSASHRGRVERAG